MRLGIVLWTVLAGLRAGSAATYFETGPFYPEIIIQTRSDKEIAIPIYGQTRLKFSIKSSHNALIKFIFKKDDIESVRTVMITLSSNYTENKISVDGHTKDVILKKTLDSSQFRTFHIEFGNINFDDFIVHDSGKVRPLLICDADYKTPVLPLNSITIQNFNGSTGTWVIEDWEDEDDFQEWRFFKLDWRKGNALNRSIDFGVQTDNRAQILLLTHPTITFKMMYKIVITGHPDYFNYIYQYNNGLEPKSRAVVETILGPRLTDADFTKYRIKIENNVISVTNLPQQVIMTLNQRDSPAMLVQYIAVRGTGDQLTIWDLEGATVPCCEVGRPDYQCVIDPKTCLFGQPTSRCERRYVWDEASGDCLASWWLRGCVLERHLYRTVTPDAASCRDACAPPPDTSDYTSRYECKSSLV